MKHKPKTDEEIAKEGLLPEGIYDFEVAAAEEKVSKSGNDMFQLNLHVYGPDGEARTVRDWVLPSFPKKYKHLHDALGLLDLYQTGETKEADLVGKSGKVIIVIGEPYTDKNGMEQINNSVSDYVKRDDVSGAPVTKKGLPKDVEEDEVPF
jgi:hypothetical protein